MHQAHTTAPADRVSLRTKLGWGAGGVADNFILNVVNVLGLLIYTEHFKMDPKLAGIALFIPRFVDSILDPLIGNWSDNTRSKWGRRRPWMAAGAVLSAVLMPFLWIAPVAGTVDNVWYKNIPFIYLTVMGTIYFTAYSLYAVPYTALGYELTNDYDERTRTLSWRMYIGLLASMTVPWFYKFCKIPLFPNEGTGAVILSILLGVIVVVTGLLPVIFCREREDVQHQQTVNIFDAMGYTLGNKPFMILIGAFVIVILGLFSAGNIGQFLNIYYVCKLETLEASKQFAGSLSGYAGTLSACTSYVSMFLVTALSVRWSKRYGMNIGLSLALAAVVISWFALDPRWPWMVLVPTFITALGLQGCWLMISSMIADICDEDELTCGVRREGMFGAMYSFFMKVSLALTSLIGGYLLAWSGVDAKQAEIDQGVPPEVAMKLKILFISFQAVALAVAIAIFYFYPITRERAAETRRLLDERKQAAMP